MQRVKKLSLALSILFLSIALLAACGGGGNTAPTPAPAPGPNESAGESDLLAVGEQQVQQSCLSCHGTDLKGGMGGAAPDLTTTQLSKEEIIDVLQNGRGSMPAGTAKGNEEAVAEYILSLQ